MSERVSLDMDCTDKERDVAMQARPMPNSRGGSPVFSLRALIGLIA